MQAMLNKKAGPKKEHKKEHSNIIICPRCGAGNLSQQSACGRCGLVFPKEKATTKGKKGEELPGPPSLIPPSLPGAPKGGQPPMMGGGDEETPEPQAPKRPKQLPEKGATEGISKELGAGGASCPRCGASVKDGVKRCPHCGFRQ
ncbi:zinc-ribbon domain protein [uncultured archaeon]|nr:zinc-ribbon domain protein [uncultured archaeon]